MQIRRKSIDSSLRLVKLLSLIPKAGRAIGTQAIQKKLAAADFKVDLRTVQRDLNRLERPFSLFRDTGVSEDGRTEPVWSFMKNAAEFSAPGLDASSALAYRLVEQHLSGFFPPELLRELQPRFAAARAVLESSTLSKVKHFSERFCALPPGLQFIAPVVPAEISDCVHLALLNQRLLHVSYLPMAARAPKSYELSVLGMVVRGVGTYLVVRIADFEDVRILALHRIQSAELLDAPTREPENFDFAAYVAAELDWRVGETAWFSFEVRPELARILTETPISTKQEISPPKRGWCAVRAWLADTYELERWLLSQGKLLRKVQKLPL